LVSDHGEPQGRLCAAAKRQGQSQSAPRRREEPPSLRVHDRDDIPILACAIAARVDCFVTGDKALLQLGEMEGLPLLSPLQPWKNLVGLDEQERPK
jgi:predicted nucleic acid-binding protein